MARSVPGLGSGSTRPLLYTHKWHWQPDPQVLDSPMEQHALPFACTTNLADRLDRASLRRFVVKVWLYHNGKSI